ncbi:MAG: hypothetical protein KOO62_02440 [candidate division Zixibacteria bacterium]|nr:hypothetical protein [candidate division Zixibacteria bacterium]
MANGIFVTAINCMDGRTQLPVNEWLRTQFKADYVDTITEPGPDKILSEPANPLADSIKNRVLISVEKHGSKVIAIVAHGGCAGNPVTKEEHLEMVKKAVATVAGWVEGVTVLGLWLDDSDWVVKKIC